MTLRVLLAALVLAAAPSLAAAQTLQPNSAPVQAALRYAEAQGPALGLGRADTEAPLVTDAYLDEATGIGHVYLRQQVGGIEVAEANFNVTLGRTGEVVYMTGAFYAAAAARTNTDAPSLTAEAAVVRAAALTGEAVPTAFRATASLNGPSRGVTFDPDGRSDQPVTARLVYQPMEDGSFRLAWETLFYPTGRPHVWLVRVDAVTGAELARYDLVVTDTWGEALEQAREDVGPWLFSDAPASGPLAAHAAPAMVGSYRVFAMPVESPIHATPASPADGRTLAVNPDNALASPFGWHDTNGAAGAEFTITRGNNAYAYTDVDGNNSPDAGSAPDGGAGLAFDFALDLTQAPSSYRPAAVTNTFYWSNIIHDVTYQYGFTEAAGNFQTNNYGRGGVGNDALNAEAQDGSDTENARFFPAVDGVTNRMEMYLWPAPNPDRDGDFDAGVMTHEYGHGVSTRLTGGPATVSCLNNSEQMGEGWSDYYGLMLTMRAADIRTTNRGVGNYVLNLPTTGPGIRPVPYNTNFAVNDYTYQDTRTAAVPHGVGFIWATIIWEATWDMIDAHGFSADFYNAAGTSGNQMMMRLVTEAMKLQPCSPGFVDGRNAILAADAALYPDASNPGRGLHYTTLWTAFARRGLGFSATQGSTNSNSDNTEAFDVPLPPPVAAIATGPLSAGLAPGGTTTRPFTIQNTAASGSSSLTYSISIQSATTTPSLAPTDGGASDARGIAAPKGSNADAGTGAAPSFNSGGPDGFGYTWKDSSEPAGPGVPTVAFQNIAATGTQITAWTATGTNAAGDEGYTDVALPFSFPFYGTPRTSVRISTNGMIHFSTFAADNFTNGTLPATATPNSVIAPFWDDLDMSASGTGTVHTGTLPDGRFVVQWTGVKRWNQPGSLLTFEILLSPDGTIEFQYGTLTTPTLNSATVGIENDGGTVGLQVVNNAAYLASNRAVRFTAPPTWLSVSPGAGSIAPGASAAQTVTFNAAGLAAGRYTATLVVTTNDPDHLTTNIPVTLDVAGVTIAGQAGWRMMAVPTSGMTVASLATQNLVQGVPGYYPTANTNLYTGYSGSAYTAPATGTDALVAGRGFIWYFYNQNLTPGGPSNSVALPAQVRVPANSTEPASNVAVGLHAAGNRWNLVGNPFMSGLDVSTMNAWASGGTLASAVGQVWDPNAGGSGSYVLTSSMGAVVAPWQGFFVENTSATTLTIPTSAKVAGGVFHRTEDVDTRLVGFELSASTPTGGPLLDRAIALYFHPDGTDAWDIWDATKLTPISTPYATLAFEGTRDGNNILKAQDSRPLEATTFSVPLALTAIGTATSFTLRWPQMTNVPATWTMTLQDVVTGTTVDLRTTDHYDFTATPSAAAGTPETPSAVAANASQAVTRFILTVTTATTATEGGATPAALALGEPTPNPSAGAVALRYDVPAAADVRLEVFDVLGRRVATLVEGPSQAGRYTARWEPQGLSSGTYVVRLISGDVVLARRVTLTR